jgi:hypothetical protein
VADGAEVRRSSRSRPRLRRDGGSAWGAGRGCAKPADRGVFSCRSGYLNRLSKLGHGAAALLERDRPLLLRANFNRAWFLARGTANCRLTVREAAPKAPITVPHCSGPTVAPLSARVPAEQCPNWPSNKVRSSASPVLQHVIHACAKFAITQHWIGDQVWRHDMSD